MSQAPALPRRRRSLPRIRCAAGGRPDDWESWADAPDTPRLGGARGGSASPGGNGGPPRAPPGAAGRGGAPASDADKDFGDVDPLATHTSQTWSDSSDDYALFTPWEADEAGGDAGGDPRARQQWASSASGRSGSDWELGGGEESAPWSQLERCYLKYAYSIEESLGELSRLAETAGLEVVGYTYQQLEEVNPRTFVGSGKVQEIRSAVAASGAETVIFDDELSPGQARNLERALGETVRLCDRTALILDIFSQRAATREGKLQVELAQTEYQLPRLTRMWTHLERQSGGGQVKGMGEKQIEVDRRLLKGRIARLKRELDEVRTHRKAYRQRRAQAPIPVIALVGYTNAGNGARHRSPAPTCLRHADLAPDRAGKSTLLNTLTGAGVTAEDKLFATLDPTTRRVELHSGQEVLISDTVGFIQKLPTQLVAAFRATLEEIAEASLLLHVVDIDSVNAVLKELGVQNLPMLLVWNKVDACPDPAMVRAVAAGRDSTVCVSGLTGEGLEQLLEGISSKLQHSMVAVHVLVPYQQARAGRWVGTLRGGLATQLGELVDEIHRTGVVQRTEFTAEGTEVQAHVPPALAMRLRPLRLAAAAAAQQDGAALEEPAAAGEREVAATQ
eukprot:scaffold24.g2959.t1